MKIYRLDYKTVLHVLEGTDSNGFNYVPKEIPHTKWFASERKAAIRRLELFRLGVLVGKKRDAQIWGVEVDTRKEGLVAWLNQDEVTL